MLKLITTLMVDQGSEEWSESNFIRFWLVLSKKEHCVRVLSLVKHEDHDWEGSSSKFQPFWYACTFFMISNTFIIMSG